jgi:glutamine amidotransferase
MEGGRPKIVKSPQALFRESAKLRKAARRVKGNVLIGHVRWASNPLKLPKQDLIGLRHTQPFSYKNWIFAHNGTLLIPKEVRAELGPLEKYIEGNNDSEVLFYWLMKYLRWGSRGQMAQSVRRSLRDLDRVWEKCRKKYPLYKYPYHGLNWVLTNGKILIAMCFVNPAGFGKAKALVHRKEPYYQLRYKQSPTGWIAASEPLDNDPHWKLLRHGQILITDGTQGWFM